MLLKKDRPISLVLLGSRGLGKTEWARSLGKHFYARGQVIYDEVVESLDARYAVLDDLHQWEFRYLKDMLGGQPDCLVTGKWRMARRIPWGKPVIICTNEEFWSEWTDKQQEYFSASTKIIRIYSELY